MNKNQIGDKNKGPISNAVMIMSGVALGIAASFFVVIAKGVDELYESVYHIYGDDYGDDS